MPSTIAHTQLVDPADVERFVGLGVVANFEPYWAKYDSWQTELTAPRLGDVRTNRQFMMGTILQTGAPISFGSDWPVCTARASLRQWLAAAQEVTADWPEADRRKLFHDNAVKVYKLQEK